MVYFVVSTDEDGDIRIHRLTHAQLIRKLNDNQYGDDVCWVDADFLKKHPDPQRWTGAVLVIQGTSIVPKPQKIVETWKL